MKADSARMWIICGSLVITGLQCLFLLIAPAFGFPLPFPKNLDVLQSAGPVFLGYLGASSHYIFRESAKETFVRSKFLGPIVIGPLLIYLLLVSAVLVAFGYSNRVGAALGGGMSFDNLNRSLSIILGLLAVTTGVITSYLFAAETNSTSSGTH